MFVLQGNLQSVLGEDGVGKDVLRLLEQHVFGLVAGGEVAEDEAVDLCVEGDLGGLGGGAVEGLLGEEGVLVGEGGFVVEAGDAADEVNELGTVSGICAISIRTDRVGGGGESVVGDECAVSESPVHACLDVVNLGDGDVVEVNHIATNMTRCRLLAEEESAARDAMGEGEGGNNDGSIFIDGLWNLGVDFVKENLVRRIGTKVIDLWLEDALEVLGAVDMEVLGTPEKSEGGEHADEPKGMVAMQMSEENGLEMGEADVGTT